VRFELHCHSTCSDGVEPPERIGERARERAVAVFALTDHDSCDGFARAAAAAGEGVRTIRGVEISCDDRGRTIHVLAYDRGHHADDWAVLEAKLAEVRIARANRMRVMAAKLAMRGIRVDVEPLIATSNGRSLGRPDLARLMIAAGAASTLDEAFSYHLYDGGPVDVPHRTLTLPDALALGRRAGAAMALAHPHLYDDRSAALVRTHKAAGLTGIEAFHGAYDPRERSRWLAVADREGVTCTGGSDWHGPTPEGQHPGPLVGVDLPEDRSVALLAWLT
jgi:3',5'-nucleoside bisphosphate phosphatase